ncbi:hypothetical protein ACGF8D_10800 [Streptomyces massasporeus]|uniref:hypothetical protein n=1 Tax=Streptomyces massasporeus TaxID=67324 RepID=UPI0037119DB4
MHKSASIAVVVALVLGGAAACGDGDSTSEISPISPPPGITSPSTPQEATTPQSPSPETPRELKKGQTISVTTDDGPAEITLLAVHNSTVIGDEKADAGQQYVVYSMQVKNLGTTGEWDTYWLGSPRWSGSDGEADSPVFVVGPEDPKLIPYDPFTSTPEPRPGEHIRATQVLGVPNISGTLQFEDSPGNTQFNIIIR